MSDKSWLCVTCLRETRFRFKLPDGRIRPLCDRHENGAVGWDALNNGSIVDLPAKAEATTPADDPDARALQEMRRYLTARSDRKWAIFHGYVEPDRDTGAEGYKYVEAICRYGGKQYGIRARLPNDTELEEHAKAAINRLSKLPWPLTPAMIAEAERNA